MRDRVAVVARATFLEAVRDRVLLVSVAFALGMVLFSRVLGWLSLEDTLKMIQDFSLTALQLLALLLAMLLGAGSLAREVERRTIYTVLSRDCTRGEFLLGKFAGLVAVSWTCLLLGAAAFCVWVTLWGGPVGEATVAAILGILAESVVLNAAALLLGSLANPAIASVGTLCFYLAGHATSALLELARVNADRTVARSLDVLHRIVPNLEGVNFINHTTSGRAVVWADLGLGALLMVVWSGVFLTAASLLFRRRQF